MPKLRTLLVCAATLCSAAGCNHQNDHAATPASNTADPGTGSADADRSDTSTPAGSGTTGDGASDSGTGTGTGTGRPGSAESGGH